jgi:hypothetical protein
VGLVVEPLCAGVVVDWAVRVVVDVVVGGGGCVEPVG